MTASQPESAGVCGHAPKRDKRIAKQIRSFEMKWNGVYSPALYFIFFSVNFTPYGAVV
jgi:hypothetical protein